MFFRYLRCFSCSQVPVVEKIVAENVAAHSEFESRVDMWTFEEKLKDGRLLSHVINSEHENVKYMPGLKVTSQ